MNMLRAEGGQSLVEMALALPLLLLLLLGLVDTARIYASATQLTNATHEGALYAARNRTATDALVKTRVCDELGYSTAACAAVVQLCRTTSDAPPCDATFNASACAVGDVCVNVKYALRLISGDFAARFVSVNPVTLRGAAVVPDLGIGQ
jgi:Flp pilus assembly protein TadG